MSKETFRPGNAAGPTVRGQELMQIMTAALDSTAVAYENISRYSAYAGHEGMDVQGNLEDARYYAGSAMVNLVLAAVGSDDDGLIRDTLSRYGLVDLLYP